MKLSITIAGHEFTLGTQKSAASPASTWLRADDLTDVAAEGAKLTSPYSQSAWVYIAVSRLAEKISSIPFRISQLDSGHARRVRAVRGSSEARHRSFVRRALGESIVESGPVVDLFTRPHPMMNRQLFWEMVVTWNCLRGECFILPLDAADQPVDLAAGSGSPRIERLLTLPTELFWHVVTGYELTAWRYTGSPLLTPIPGEMLLPSEVIHSRTPNPYLFWRGMSPLAVAMLAAGADYAASQYNKGYWLNNADTGVIVTTDQQATPEQRAAILSALRERKRKAGTADRPLFLWGGAKVEKPQLSGMESQFIENRRMNRQEIGAIFKVPESVMGFSDDKSSALSGGGQAISAEQLQFIESTICPLCEHLEAAVEPIVKSFGENLIGWFDIESLPIMQEARRARLDAGVKAFGIGAAFNDINRAYDLGFPEYAWGHKSYLPSNLVEVGTTKGEEEKSLAKQTKEAKASTPFTRMLTLLRCATACDGRAALSPARREANLKTEPPLSLQRSHDTGPLAPSGERVRVRGRRSMLTGGSIPERDSRRVEDNAALPTAADPSIALHLERSHDAYPLAPSGDLRSLGSDERNSAEPKAPCGPSERERASHWARVRGHQRSMPTSSMELPQPSHTEEPAPSTTQQQPFTEEPITSHLSPQPSPLL